MIKQIYYKNLRAGVGAPTSIMLPVQVLGLQVGEEIPADIDFADVTNLKVRLKKIGGTGVGKELSTSGAEKYEIQGSAISVTLGARKKDEQDELTIVGQYGNVGVYAVIKLFYKVGVNEFILNPYILRVTGAGGCGVSGISEITYSELKALRDSGTLSSGYWYRITDYKTTTKQENTFVAGHDFDILVFAVDSKTLSEEAKAVAHIGDTYYSTADLDAWQIWYSLDNDTTRFAWADETDGRGVIWRMIDEWGNECPYDFKNILYLSSGEYFYTFDHATGGTHIDFSIFGNDKSISSSIAGCYGNVIKEYVSSQIVYQLNANIFKNSGTSEACLYNEFGYNCYNNTFGNNCHSNTFGSDCHSNTFGNDCHSNTFGSDCHSNTFGINFYSNTFGSGCKSNTSFVTCYKNTFGKDCSNNIISNNFYKNTIDNGCTSNTFANDFSGNYFESNCFGITFLKSFVQKIIVSSGANSLRIDCAQTTSVNEPLKNVHINGAVNNKTITIPTANNNFLTIVGTANDAKINV